MRAGVQLIGLTLAAGVAAPASAATVVVYADPVTLERRTVVINPDGPDRAFLCMLPPSDAGCIAVPLKRSRR